MDQQIELIADQISTIIMDSGIHAMEYFRIMESTQKILVRKLKMHYAETGDVTALMAIQDFGGFNGSD